MPAAAPFPDSPPIARLVALDSVRGVAVLGILLLNIVSFGLPDAAYLNPRAYGGWHGADLAAYLVNFVLFDGKMRGLFSFLFGASMLLVIERAQAKGESAASVHYRRMGWLLAFGLAHLWLVWKGDILAHYALIGMLAFGLRDLSTPRLLVLGTMLIGATSVLFAALPITILAGHDPRAFVEIMGIPAPDRIARELALYRGDYAGILRARFAAHAASPLAMLWVYGPETMAYMLFGMAGLKSGMLRGEWPRARYWRWLRVCWGIALPVYVALAVWLVVARFDLFAVAVAAWALPVPLRPLMIAGWACLILLLAKPGGALTGRIAAAGRMAFTNYLATSLIATTLFYGYGLGWFGTLSRWQLYLVVAALWAAMLLWSQPWLARFRFGPFEWAWRSLARGRWQNLRGAASV